MPDKLDNDWRDRAALVTKVAASLVPIVGGPLAELITEIIPRQRQERIVEYLRALNTRLKMLETERINRIMADTEKVDLIESGGHLAARATSPERISRLAEIVLRGLESDEANFVRLAARATSPERISRLAEIVLRGLESDEANFVRRKRLLGLFGEIDDDEFLILDAYGGRISAPDRTRGRQLTGLSLPISDRRRNKSTMRNSSNWANRICCGSGCSSEIMGR